MMSERSQVLILLAALVLGSAHGAQHPFPQPPSLPPLSAAIDLASLIAALDAEGAKAVAAGLAVNGSTELTYTYVWQEGFIGSGGDVLPPVQVTVAEALSICDRHARCRGITYSGSNATKAKQHIYFKMDAGIAHSAGLRW